MVQGNEDFLVLHNVLNVWYMAYLLQMLDLIGLGFLPKSLVFDIVQKIELVVDLILRW
jgi:hypothetical protein